MVVCHRRAVSNLTWFFVVVTMNNDLTGKNTVFWASDISIGMILSFDAILKK